MPVPDRGWFFGGAIRYLETKAAFDDPATGGDTLKIDPFVVQAMAGYRF